METLEPIIEEELKKLKAKVVKVTKKTLRDAAKVAKAAKFNPPKMGAKATNENFRDEYITPRSILDPLSELWPEGYFDPCPNKADFNAFDIDWLPNAFINPPFSEYKKWVIYGLTQPCPQVWLMNTNTSTDYYKLLVGDLILPFRSSVQLQYGISICLIAQRLKFIHPITMEACDNSMWGKSQMLIYRGPDHYGFHKAFQKVGGIYKKI